MRFVKALVALALLAPLPAWANTWWYHADGSVISSGPDSDLFEMAKIQCADFATSHAGTINVEMHSLIGGIPYYERHFNGSEANRLMDLCLRLKGYQAQ